MRRSVVASGDERNEGRGTWDLLMANEEHGSGAVNPCGVLTVPGRTWDEERRGTRKVVGRGTTSDEGGRETREYERDGTTRDEGARTAPLSRAGSVPRS